MKKYIKTKDGLWLFGGTHHNGDVIIGKKHEIDFGYCFDKRDIIKQADTIEKLCDCFVFVSPNLTYPQLVIPMNFDYVKKEFEPVIIYGAIWTDKGLIYVAKMNEKGEFELL